MPDNPFPAEPSPVSVCPPAVPRKRGHRARYFVPVVLLILGASTAAAAWLIVAVVTDSRAGWMALPAGVAMGFLLRVGQFPQHTSRPVLAALATTLGIVASDWLVGALSIGAAMGQLPFVAACYMGWDFAWTLTRLGSTPLDWACSGVAILLAAWFAR